MDDLEFRRRVLRGDTHSLAVEEAARDNQERQRWLQQARALEVELHTTLQQPTPAHLSQQLKQIPTGRSRWLPALAAAIAVLSVTATLLFTQSTPSDLDNALLEHIAAEPNTLYNREPVSAATVNLVARRLGYQFTTPQTNISYAGTCAVKGKQAVHLTVQSGMNSATVFLLPEETLNAPHNFDHHHLHGRLLPLSRGSAAIVSTSPALLDQLEATTLQSLAF